MVRQGPLVEDFCKTINAKELRTLLPLGDSESHAAQTQTRTTGQPMSPAKLLFQSKSHIRERTCCSRAFLLKCWLALFIVCVVLLLALIGLALWETSPNEISVAPLVISKTDYNGTVLIVGAGAAGLFAGYTLEYLGMQNYQILEASAGFGGRVQELPDFLDVPIDLGAEWIHGDPKVLQDLLLFEADLVTDETISYQPQTYSVFIRSHRKRRNVARFFYREFKFRNTTWYSYLRDYVVTHVESKLAFDTVVDTIDYSGVEVRVVTKAGQVLLADKVILAIPLAVMNSVHFIPELPESKVQAVQNVFVPSGIKVWIEFDEQFYPDVQTVSTIFGVYDEGPGADPFYFNTVFRKPSNRHALTYFNVGVDTIEITKLSDDEILSKLMAQLDDIFDGEATRHYVKHHIQNWGKVPFVRGAYSDDWVDYEWTVRELARPLDQKLYFAGEHTEEIEVATVHGAAMSGRRAAQELLLDGE
jgi:monoamine oxidase